ncbi:hypothetical protein [Bradyrhizobium sp. SYSU BS000235]|uniref:hypothetical protein n=1 Tax=Bradyrhizobium sp. SYSU BS000235 TaxID=3411332 RepID=UPI003C725D95
MLHKLKKWYEGEFEYPHQNPNILTTYGRYRRHWTSQFTHIAVDFYLREWKWVLGAIGGTIALLFFRK